MYGPILTIGDEGNMILLVFLLKIIKFGYFKAIIEEY